MAVYKINPKGIDTLRKKMTIISLGSLVVIIIVMLILNRNSMASGDNTMLYVIPIVSAYILFSIWRTTKKQRKALEAFTLTIKDDEIVVQQLGDHVHTINFMEIRKIIKTSKGHFLIQGEGAGNRVAIPKYVEDYDQLEAELSKLGEIQTDVKDPFKQKQQMALMIVVLAGFVCVYAVDNKAVVGIAGTVSIAGLSWLFYRIQTHKVMSPKVKRGSWWMIFAIVAVAYAAITKIMI